MPEVPSPSDLSPALAACVDAIERGQWSALLLDGDWRIRWASTELQDFLGEVDPAALGYGRHLAEAWNLPAWTRATDAESIDRLVREVGPFMLGDLARRGAQLEDAVPGEHEGLDGLSAVAPPPVWSTWFRYVDPDGVEELGGFTVKALFLRVGEPPEDGGWLMVFDVAVRPRLVALLARGDQAMYERMARLVQPGRRTAAILFCDLQGSASLSRRLPTGEYFTLVRRLWTATDETVAAHLGMVGMHAGDGASAFFLAEDLGGESETARAAVLTARRIHELSAEVFRDAVDLDCLMKVGVHWGAGLYMGQLVPGSRLEVTALGDEVNEAARIQEAAGPHETLASKQLLERLTPHHAAELGLDQAVVYELLADRAPAGSKIVRDAGGIAVTRV